MNNVQANNEKGFTIIEVVLVLAIAALIFLMVFIALPALQRNQRDQQRRQDLGRISTQIANYQASNRGQIPSTTNFTASGTGFVARYLKGTGGVAGADEYSDPSTGGGYTFDTTTSDALDVGEINYQTGRVCGTDGAATATGAGGRNFVIRVKLESQTSLFCIDNRS